MKTDGSPLVRTERSTNLIPPLNGGRNLYAGPPPSSFLYVIDPAGKSRRNYATSATEVLDFFHPSGDGLHGRLHRGRRVYKPVAMTSLVIRWVDLGSGRDQSLPPFQPSRLCSRS
jgi:hypothetical protein